jgi:manganese efflux pump family protein
MATCLNTWGKYVAAALVLGLGLKMLYEVIRSHPGSVAEKVEHAEKRALHPRGQDPTRGWSLVAISVATSIDALVVGFSLALKEVEWGQGAWTYVLRSSLVIGLVAGLMALIGVAIGQGMGKAMGKRAELAGALVLIALAVSFLWY